MSAAVVEISQRLGEWVSWSTSDCSASFPFLPCSWMLWTCRVELTRGILHGCVLDQLKWQIQERFYSFSYISESREVHLLLKMWKIFLFSVGGMEMDLLFILAEWVWIMWSVLFSPLDYCKMLLYSFQNKQFLILAQGVFDRQAFVIIHYLLGKQLPCLYIYSTV